MMPLEGDKKRKAHKANKPYHPEKKEAAKV